jgi:hypothetical protein
VARRACNQMTSRGGKFIRHHCHWPGLLSCRCHWVLLQGGEAVMQEEDITRGSSLFGIIVLRKRQPKTTRSELWANTVRLGGASCLLHLVGPGFPLQG